MYGIMRKLLMQKLWDEGKHECEANQNSMSHFVGYRETSRVCLDGGMFWENVMFWGNSTTLRWIMLF